MRRTIQKKVTLPIRWKYQRMKVIDSIVYEKPKVLLEQLEVINTELPQASRANKERYQFLLGQQSILKQILYGKDGKTEDEKQ